MGTPSAAALVAMERACEGRYAALVRDGCDEDVAADRTFDALEHATGERDGHAFDGRDRLFESELRTIREGIDR